MDSILHSQCWIEKDLALNMFWSFNKPTQVKASTTPKVSVPE